MTPELSQYLEAQEAAKALRTEVESIARQLAVIAPPASPDELITKPGLRGPLWNVNDSFVPEYRWPWRVRAIDDEPGHFVYVHHPRTFDPSDFETMTVDEARRLAMALLAACDYVGDTELEKARKRKAAVCEAGTI